MSGGRVIWPGEVVEEGDGPVRCPNRHENGRLCSSLLGWPAVGSVLVDVLEVEPGEEIGPCRSGLNAYRCYGCGSLAVFRPEEVAKVGSDA